jgi:Zn-dependent alcohol dehydrogenase
MFFPAMINHYDNNNLLLEKLVTETYCLSQFDKAFDDVLQGKNTKGVIKF